MFPIPEQLQNLRPDDVSDIRAHCSGITPLHARVETWMVDLIRNRVKIQASVQEHGSPLNLISTGPFARNVKEFRRVGESHGVDFEVYFARKANKCLAFVDEAKSLDCGVDVASENELRQVLDRGVKSSRIICTAAIKTKELLELCVERQVTVAIDNLDELHRLQSIKINDSQPANIALRVSGFQHEGEKLFSRFGFDIDQVVEMVKSSWNATEVDSNPRIVGLHFHLDGYDHQQRISAIWQSLHLIDELRSLGHPIEFLDMGGGIPVNYLESKEQWNTFWETLNQALLDERTPITYRNHSLGLMQLNGKIHGRPRSYPFHQSRVVGSDDRHASGLFADQPEMPSHRVQSAWLHEVLGARIESETIGHAIRERELQLRCEPGRSLLDGCGMTVAQVEFRKQHPDGHWLIGLAMNHTQCRTSSDDFLVDPILVPVGNRGDDPVVDQGYLVGAYCTESELLCKRLLKFPSPSGVENGDLIVFPNTAGYFMHFLESRSHQFPLAKNLLVDQSGDFKLDPIDEK